MRVLRAQLQEQATLFNGQGGEYLATLTEINKNAFVTIENFNPANRDALLKLF